MRFLKSYTVVVLLVLTCMFLSSQAFAQEKIGVLYIVHGGFKEFSGLNMFDSSLQIFAVRPDHPVHKLAIWSPGWWPLILQSGNGPKELGKYSFEYARLGGLDPFTDIIDSQIAQMTQMLQDRAWPGAEFFVEDSGWITPERLEQFPYPRFVYNPAPYANGSSNMTYCGEGEQGNGLSLDFSGSGVAFSVGQTLTGVTSGATAVIEDVSDDTAGTLFLSNVTGSFTDAEWITGSGGGWSVADGTTHWDGCDPDRYDVDGPAERFIAEGVDRIIAVDLTTSGVRFFKTYDTLELIRKALADNGRSDITIDWVNDPNDLMLASLPTAPVGNWGTWNPDLGAPEATFIDPSVPLAGNPNPIAEDMMLAQVLVEGTEASFNSAVPDVSTGIVIMNHATRDYAQYFDPKIDDTLILNQNIKDMLLVRHPSIDPDNIVGAYMGIKEDGTAEGYDGEERTRNMRGENLGHAWLYETSAGPETYSGHGLLPGDEWGYMYWDALEYLKNRGVEHIVICFPQIVADSVLNLVEQPNQIAKEIGYKNWLNWGDRTSSTPSNPDYATYPSIGHPFADYWGIWVDTECDNATGSGTVDCCFEMGGCGDDSRPYPPPRQTTGARDDLDPSLGFDVSEFGHLGYNPAVGLPDLNNPVQNQYTGTWAYYRPPNEDARLVDMLVDHVLAAAGAPAIYGNVGVSQAGIDVTVYTTTCGAPNPVMTVQTDATGNYVFETLSNSEYQVLPSDTNYTFSMDSLFVNVPQAEIEPVNFTATLN